LEKRKLCESVGLLQREVREKNEVIASIEANKSVMSKDVETMRKNMENKSN
jgi:histone H3/H4